MSEQTTESFTKEQHDEVADELVEMRTKLRDIAKLIWETYPSNTKPAGKITMVLDKLDSLCCVLSSDFISAGHETLFTHSPYYPNEYEEDDE